MAFEFIRKAFSGGGERKASATGPLVAMQGAGRAVWTPRDGASLARAGYAGNVIGFRCVRMIAEAAASTPMIAKSGGAALAEHPLLGLIDRPNASQDGAAFFEALYGHLLLAGDSYVEAVGEGETPFELHVLRPDRMRVRPGADGWPDAYEYQVGGRVHRFDMRGDHTPILHLRSFHPLDDHYGMSPLEAAATSIDLHNAASAWTKALLDNAARPSGAIVYQGSDGSILSDEQYRRLTEELEDNHQGAKNAGRPLLLEGGLDWKPMGHSPSDMEHLQTKNAAARDIALAFGVPPMLLGLPGDNTYSNYQEANRAFWRHTVLPLVRRVGAAVSGWVGDRYEDRPRLEPDLDAIPALADEREARWKRISDADFLSDAEKRSLLGLPAEPVAGGGR